jgi:hypothetical protein
MDEERRSGMSNWLCALLLVLIVGTISVIGWLALESDGYVFPILVAIVFALCFLPGGE